MSKHLRSRNSSLNPIVRENPFYLAMFIGAFLSSLLAFLLPENVYAAWPAMASFVDLMTSLIPSVGHLTKLSKFPQVTGLIMSLQWAIWGPVCIWLLMEYGQPTEAKVSNALRVLQARWWYVLFLPPIAVAFLWLFVFFPFPDIGSGSTPFDQIVRWMSESRLLLGIFGSLFVTFAALIIMGLLRSFTLIRFAYNVRESSPFYKKR